MSLQGGKSHPQFGHTRKVKSEAVKIMSEGIPREERDPEYLQSMYRGRLNKLFEEGLARGKLSPAFRALNALASLGETDSPLFELALELEQVALKDEYFISKNLYPNVDFYSGIIFKAMGMERHEQAFSTIEK